MAASDSNLFEFLLLLADERLILGHRLSEWCGHAPILEEDIALANIALDLIGQATLLFRRAAAVENKNRSEDALAFLRDASEFRNVNLVEQPNGDFAQTIARQFFFDAYSVPLLETLCAAEDKDLAAIAAKAIKEDRYHLRHSSEWMLRLGDGTTESARRLQSAVDQLWPLTSELFFISANTQRLIDAGKIPLLTSVQSVWHKEIDKIFAAAKLKLPANSPTRPGGRLGNHSAHLTPLLTEMQTLQRSYPSAQW